MNKNNAIVLFSVTNDLFDHLEFGLRYLLLMDR